MVPFSHRRLVAAARAVVCGLVLCAGLAAVAPGCSEIVSYNIDRREKGLEFYKAEQYHEAAGAFRAALQQDPRDYVSHYYLGMSLLQTGGYQQAQAAFRSCLQVRTQSFNGQADEQTMLLALDGLAMAIVKSDETDREPARIEQAARAAKGAQQSQEYYLLAKVYRYRRLPDMAIEAYNRACLADPANFHCRKESGLYLEQLQQNPKAVSVLKEAYAIYDKDKDVNGALRRMGVVTGPSLKNKADLAQPVLPLGPIPELDMAKVRAGLGLNNEGGQANSGTGSATPSGTAAAPKD